MIEQALPYWSLSIVILFGFVALGLAIRDYRRDKTVYVDPPEPAPVPLVPRFSEPPQGVCTTIDQIHEKYADMKETDPKRAGRLMYEEQLRLHGQ